MSHQSRLRPFTSLKRRLHAGAGAPKHGDRRRSEAGDTLIEILIALGVLSIAAVAILVAFGTALTGSAEHRNLTNISLAEKTINAQIIAQLENNSGYQSCAPLSTYQPGGSSAIAFSGLPANFTAEVSGVSYWTTSYAFSADPAACVANGPQLVSATLTSPSGNTSTVSAVVDDPAGPSLPIAGDATGLAWYTQPGGAQSGQNLGPQPVVEVVDKAGNVVTTDLSDVILTLTGANGGTVSNGASLSNTCSGSEFYGVVTFGNCSVLTDGTYTLTATDTSLPGVSITSSTFVVTVGPASQVVFTQQPGGNPTGGVAFGIQPKVTVEDAGGNVVTADASTIALSITSSTPTSGGPGTLSGCSSTESQGVFTFAGCAINTSGTGYELTATDTQPSGTIKSSPSSPFNVSTGSAYQLAFTQSPSSSSGGSAFGTQPKVAIEDAGGNVVTSASASVTLGINSQPTTGASLACSKNPLTTSNGTGTASFSACTITNGSGEEGSYTLKATATGLVAGISSPFTVAGGATQLAFTTAPAAQTSNTVFPNSSQPVVAIEDAAGDLVTNANSSITLSIASQPTSGATFNCTTNPITANNGIASFAGCLIKNASGEQGAYTLQAKATGLTTAVTPSFTVAGAATKLIFTQQPAGSTGGVAFLTQPQITVEDSSGDPVTSSTASIQLAVVPGSGTTGATLSCTTNPLTPTAGVATFGGCAINLVGTGYQLKATTTGLTAATSTAFNISLGAPYMLAFSTQPGGGTNGAAWSTQPVVTIEDAGGNPEGAGTSTVSLAISSQPGTNGALACASNPVAATAGVASFSSCQITGKAGANYTVTASASGLVSATSSPFSISVGSASQLAFTTQPGGGANGAVWAAQPTVAVEDSGGNTVTTASASVTLALGENQGGVLACTTNPLTTTNGVATFAGCKITGTEGPYTLTAAATGLTTGTSNRFSITFGSASQLAFTTQPGGGTDGAAWATQPVISIEDQSGNIVTSSSASVALTIASQPGSGAALSCTGGTTMAATAGVVNYAGCQITGTVGTYTISASATGLGTTTSTSLAVTLGNPAKLAFGTQPSGGTDGAAFGTQPSVSVEDVGGNPVTTATNSISLAIASQPGSGAALACTTNPLAATNGTATFSGCQITGKVGNYTISATSSGLTTATSTTFSITVGSATQLAFSTQPGGAANGAAFNTQPSVSVEDIGGNVVTSSSAPVNLAIATQPGTGAALSCTTNPLAANNGVAKFAGCKITGKSGSYTLTAASTGLTTATSSAFTITFGSASQLAFSTQPGGGTDGVAFGTQPVVTVQDQSGNTVTNSNATVTLAIASQPGSGATLACNTNPITLNGANNGVAGFSGCKITGKAGSYTISATSSGVSTATSTSFNVAVGGANQLAFSTQPSGGTDGAAFGTQPAVSVEDVGGNPVTTATNSISLAIASQPGSGAALACTTNPLAATNGTGVATFSGCKITGKIGSYTLSATSSGLNTATSNSFNLTIGSATQLAFSTQPGGAANGAAFNTQPSVSVEDIGGNVVTSSSAPVNLAIATQPGTGAALSCTTNPLAANNGVSNFAACQITGKVGNYTISATSSGLTTATSNTVAITFGSASQLAFSTQPGGGTDGVAFGTQPVVTVQDQSGNTVTNSNATVTLAIASQPGSGATLACNTNPITLNGANNGVAGFSGCKITGKAGSYTISATSSGVSTATSTSFNVAVGGANQLAFSTQPSGGTDGAAFGTQPAVSVEDVGGNPVTTATNSISLAIASQPGSGAALACTTNPLAATNGTGVATFSGCKITGKIGSYTLSATSSGLNTATSNSFNLTIGSATQLAFSTQPGGAANGAAFNTQPSVSVEDIGGNVVTSSSAPVNLAIATQPGTGAALSCTTNPLAANNGVSNFAACQITGKVGNYTISATSSGLTTATSNTVAITFGSASQLAFSTQPGGGTDGVAFGTQPVVTVQDQSGNTVTNSNATVTLAIASQPGSGATLACNTNPITLNGANNGVAGFSGCKITGKAGSYTISATSSGVSTATSTSFNVAVGGANQLAFSTQPSGGTDGAAFGTQPAVSVEDVGGNPVTTATNSISLAIASQPGSGAALACTTNPLAATNGTGVATFSGCKITGKIGSYTLSATSSGLNTATSNSFNLTIGSATQLAFSTQPGGAANGAAFNTQPSVSVEDIGGNVVTSSSAPVNLAIATQPGTGAALSCTTNPLAANNGVSNFAACQITGKVGNYTISATSSGLTTATSNTVAITFGSASQLAFSTQPGGGTDGVAFGTQPVVTVQDQSGNTVTNSNATVTLAIASQPGSGATLACNTNPITLNGANNGVAGFSGCKITGKAGSYTISATSSGVSTATSTSFNVAVGGANQLAFSTQPSGGTDGAAFGTQPAVSVEDVGGNPVTTATNSISLAIASQPGSGAALACTTNPLAATNGTGVATFSGCKITGKIGSYTLSATSSGLNTATSNSFNLTIGSATQLAFSTQPGGAANGAAFNTQPSVSVEDIGGNVVTSSSAPVNLAIATQPGTGAALSCTTNPLAANNGVSNFAACQITGKVGNYTISATSSGLTTATSNTVAITFGSASQLAFSTQPGGGTDGVAFGTQPVVTVQDQSGNTVTNSNATVTLAIASQPGSGATLACNTNPITLNGANNGVAGFSGCSITGTIGSYRLSASSTGLTTATSTSFNVTIGSATQLAFGTQPSGGTDGAAFGTQPAVSVEDVGGNPVTTATNSISLAIASQPGSGAALACTTNPLAATNGTATFSGCKITGAVGSYTLSATTSGLPTATSVSFNVAIGPAKTLVLNSQPSGGASGSIWATQPTVSVEDIGGNVVTTATNSINLAIASQPGSGAALACTTNPLAATNGTATFSGCKITNGSLAGSYTVTAASSGLTSATSSPFVVYGAASKLVLTTQPSGAVDGSIFTTQPVVTVEDAQGNTVLNSNANVSLAITSQPGTGATLACNTNPLSVGGGNNGVASFSGCSITGKIGSYTISATSSGLTTAVSSSFTLAVGGASQLAFSTQPSTGSSGVTEGTSFTTQPVVTVQDIGGNTVTTYATPVTLAVNGYTATGGGSSAGNLTGCTNPVTPSSGVATFSGCKITGTGAAGSYTLLASSGVGPIVSPTSATLTIVAGSAAQLAFSNQPNGAVNGTVWTSQPAVSVEDSNGNIVTSATNSITLALKKSSGGNANPASMTCSANPVSATAGTATFSGCKFAGANGSTTYMLTASASGFGSVNSATFNE